MELGVVVRTMGPQSTRDTIAECARAAEDAGLDHLWVPDHIAIAPDDAEGSGGRYLDPLAVLAFLAGTTSRIGLATGVLILPYRRPLPTAKWLATVQELSDGRLRVGVGIGWLGSEFRALGIDKRRRGAISDATLAFLNRCFESDEVEEHGQRFLFRPRPPRPRIYVGGAPPHALERAVRYGDGWIPMGGNPNRLQEPIDRLRELAEAAGAREPEVLVMTGLPLDDPGRAVDTLRGFAEVGAAGVVHGARYADASEFRQHAEALGGDVRAGLAGS